MLALNQGWRVVLPTLGAVGYTTAGRGAVFPLQRVSDHHLIEMMEGVAIGMLDLDIP